MENLMEKIIALAKRRGFVFWLFCLSGARLQNNHPPKRSDGGLKYSRW